MSDTVTMHCTDCLLRFSLQHFSARPSLQTVSKAFETSKNVRRLHKGVWCAEPCEMILQTTTDKDDLMKVTMMTFKALMLTQRCRGDK